MCRQTCFAVIRNIPKCFHSFDLRSFFSQLVEEKSFSCFHYKHRPEVIKSQSGEVSSSKQTNVCVVKFNNEAVRQHFIDTYHDKNWVKRDEIYLKERCKIYKFSPSNKVEVSQIKQTFYLTRKEQKYQKNEYEESFSESDLLQLSELKPPTNVMPNGNVGTPTAVFQNLIKQCVLPASIIKKLGLSFTSSGSNRRYGGVPYNYGETEQNCSNIKNKSSGENVKSGVAGEWKLGKSSINNKNVSSSNLLENVTGESSEDDSDDDGGEEWERHEALHEDVTSQERIKERLFEEEIELKWEKGGSGLVFYTDAQYWAEEQGGFDEQTTDDWDVDMSIYYGEKGDKDAKDFVQMLKEKRIQSGLNVTCRPKKVGFARKKKVGDFEKHTKGFGRKMMKKMGWDDGQRLGSQTRKGLLDPLEAEGQSSREKKGFGYHGEKLKRNPNPYGKRDSSTKETSAASTTFKNVSEGQNTQSSRPKQRKLIEPSIDFPKHKSGEPHASHSWIFPQFRSNLVSLYDRHEPMTSHTRTQLVPGDDGVVITTAFDDPLDIDEDPGLLRSQHHAALKRRTFETDEKSQLMTQLTPVSTGSKLVVRFPDLHSSREISSSSNSYFSSTLSYSSVKFVRPEDPANRYV